MALGLTVEAIERVGAETFIYGTRQHEVQGVAATPGELPPGEVIVRIPGAVGPAIGERIRAVAARDKLHLFTADGRKRVGGSRHSGTVRRTDLRCAIAHGFASRPGMTAAKTPPRPIYAAFRGA